MTNLSVIEAATISGGRTNCANNGEPVNGLSVIVIYGAVDGIRMPVGLRVECY